MFCPKCGTKALDGAEFCQKCGARLPADSAEPKQAKVADQQAQPGNDPADTLKKKKPRKLPVILGVLVLIVVAFIAVNSGNLAERGEQAKKDEEYIASQQSAAVSLSETYTNEEEGISFKYPSAWVPVSEDEFISRFGKVEDKEYPIVFLANEDEALPEENSAIIVSRSDAPQDVRDHLFIDDEQFVSTFDDDVTVKDTSITKIDSVAARKITYLDKDGIGYQTYFYANGSVIYRIDFSWMGETPGDKQRFFDAVIGSYRITASETANANNLVFPLAVSSDAEKVFQEWESTHPLGEYYHLDLISDDETDSEGNKVFLFTLETDGAGIFNMTIRKSDGHMEYIEKSGSMSMDEWYGEWFGAGDIVPGYQEPIENYWRLSGSYTGSTDMSTLSLSIYSSQEEGETAVGNVVIYTDNGKDYTGTVTPIGENAYKVAAGTGEEVLLIESVSGDVVVLQLYVDGEYLDEYRMKEHYES